MVKLIYVGEKFYRKSGTRMGTLYEVDEDAKWHRWDWGFVQGALKEGETITIVPADENELTIAEGLLEIYLG
jgi:hypothetical protein